MSPAARLGLFGLLLMLCAPRAGEAPVIGMPQPAAPDPVAADRAVALPAPSIRIEHKLIYPPVITPPVRTRPAIRKASFEPLVETPKLGRARRMLFGDGTYRPEPFPRPRN